MISESMSIFCVVLRIYRTKPVRIMKASSPSLIRSQKSQSSQMVSPILLQRLGKRSFPSLSKAVLPNAFRNAASIPWSISRHRRLPPDRFLTLMGWPVWGFRPKRVLPSFFPVASCETEFPGITNNVTNCEFPRFSSQLPIQNRVVLAQCLPHLRFDLGDEYDASCAPRPSDGLRHAAPPSSNGAIASYENSFS
jgi:hypothetical protein